MNVLGGIFNVLRKIPGLNIKNSRKLAAYVLESSNSQMLFDNLKKLKSDFLCCNLCNNFDVISPCSICSSNGRNQKKICVVASVNQLWSIEDSCSYDGCCQVLGGLLSAIDGIGPEQLNFFNLKKRINNDYELILALGSTINAEMTRILLEAVNMGRFMKKLVLALQTENEEIQASRNQ